MRTFSVAVVFACAALAGACSSGSGTQPGPAAHESSTTVPRGSFADSGEGTDWPVYGHDLANSRFSTGEHAITASTVGKLHQQWELGGLVGVTGTPVVAGATAYFDDWTGAVRAVAADTGRAHWVTKLGGMFVGAPAVTSDRVYASAGSTLYCLNRATGALVWKVQTDSNPYAQINASPVVVDGLVLQGTASFENIVNETRYTFRGSIAAYDARTGRQRWKFFTTKNTPADGPGVGIWSTPAVDVHRGLLYVGTGQSLAPKTSELADSLLAIDYRTGVLKWSTQFTYPDVFSAGHPEGKDADVGASPNLWTSNGRDLVGAGDKGGTFHALDRDTGKVVWQTRLTPGSAFGGEIGSSAFVDGKLIATSNVGDPATNAPTNVTKVFALDPATGRIVWTAAPFPGKVFAPVSAVPGVAFVATDQGTMAALATATGRRLWTHTAPAKSASGPSIVDGRVLWGYGFVLFGGAGPGGVISFGTGS
jgi:polyvinyl alcohol dehydrogenase (cytochrome)